jgi:hypothetical protein
MKQAMSLVRPGALLALALSSQAMAGTTNLDVTFTATLRETTCDMTIEGAPVMVKATRFKSVRRVRHRWGISSTALIPSPHHLSSRLRNARQV